MDELIAEIEAYATALGESPQWVLRQAINAGGGEWASWCAGASSPTLKRVDRLRAYMSANTPQAAVVEGGEAA